MSKAVQPSPGKSAKSINTNQNAPKTSTPFGSKTPQPTKPAAKVNPLPAKPSTSNNQTKNKSQTNQSKPASQVSNKVSSQPNQSNNSSLANSKPKEQKLKPNPISEKSNFKPKIQNPTPNATSIKTNFNKPNEQNPKKNLGKANSQAEIKSEVKPKNKSSSVNLSQTTMSNCIVNIESQMKTNDIKIKSITGTDKMAESKPTTSCTTRKDLSSSHSWVINSFSTRYTTGQVVISPKPITFQVNNRIRFQFQFHPRGINQTESKHAAFRLFLTESDQTEISVKATLTIKDFNNTERILYSSVKSGKLIPSQTCDWPKFASYQQIQDKSNGFLTDDKLSLCCIVEVFNIPVIKN